MFFIIFLFSAYIVIKVLIRFTETKKGSSFGLKNNGSATSIKNNNEIHKKIQ